MIHGEAVRTPSISFRLSRLLENCETQRLTTMIRIQSNCFPEQLEDRAFEYD